MFSTRNVAFDGAAVDNVSVAEVNLIIKDRDSGLFLQPDGSFAASWNKVPATLGNPGNFFTTWTWNGTLPNGNYRVNVQVKDAAGNKDPTKAVANFVIAS